MNRNRPPVSATGVLIMGGTLGAQILTITTLLFAVAYFEPPFLTTLAVLKENPTILTIVSIWFVVLSLWGIVKVTMMVGKSANGFMTQLVRPRTKDSPETL